jgi:hypothetical protein
MAKYILSTLTNSFMFTLYGEKPGDDEPNLKGRNFNMRPVKARVRIGGGANLPNTKNAFGEMSKDEEGIPFWTPRGMVTTIQDKTWEWLKDDRHFKTFVDMGHIIVLDEDPGMDHAKVSRLAATAMVPRDDHAPMTKGDSRLDRRIKVKAGNEDHVEEDFRI